MENSKKVYIAGGCFWGMEELFRVRPGIKDTEVGYLGGENDNPTYSNHPGHAEGIELTFDPSETIFKEILDYFFRIHNPTTVDQQAMIGDPVTALQYFFRTIRRKLLLKRLSKLWTILISGKLRP